MGIPPSPHDPSAVRDLADAILADDRYDTPPDSLVDRALEWVGEQISRVLSSLLGGGGGTWLAWLLILGALGGIAYLLVRHGRITLPPLERPDEPGVMIELTRSAAEWRAEADRMEAAGRWAEAIRCRHRGLVADLVRRGAIPEQAGRTAGEHLRDVSAILPEAAPAMAAATELFEAVWYGGASAGEAEVRRFRSLVDDVLAVPA